MSPAAAEDDIWLIDCIPLIGTPHLKYVIVEACDIDDVDDMEEARGIGYALDILNR